jgi:glycerophosphoryl diester phosphodiesterase
MVHPYLLDVNPRFVAAQHRMNRKVNVWTVNKAEDIQRMLAAGVDGIITDDPILALNLREAA